MRYTSSCLTVRATTQRMPALPVLVCSVCELFEAVTTGSSPVPFRIALLFPRVSGVFCDASKSHVQSLRASREPSSPLWPLPSGSSASRLNIRPNTIRYGGRLRWCHPALVVHVCWGNVTIDDDESRFRDPFIRQLSRIGICADPHVLNPGCISGVERCGGEPGDLDVVQLRWRRLSAF